MLMSMGTKIKKSSHYVLLLWPLLGITWIYYISLLAKHLITWADWDHDNIIMRTTKNISVNIVCMTAPVKRYWKTIWGDASYMEHKESSFQKLTKKEGHGKVEFTKTEHQLRLPFVIYTDFESVLRKQDLCEPSSLKYLTTQYQHHVPRGPQHLREMQWWRVLQSTPTKYRGWHSWKVFRPGLSRSNHL